MNRGVRADFIIISALQIEHEAVLRRLKLHRDLGIMRAVHARLQDGADSPAGIVVPIAEAGRVSAAVLATRALDLWHPQIVLLVGMAGGFRSAGVSVGDVIVATEILDFELQKVGPFENVVRWRTFVASQQLLGSAKAASGKPWSRKQDSSQIVYFGPMLSGEKIVASVKYADTLQSWRHDALGVEMEGAGVATAAQYCDTRFMMIRGVADLADECKSDSYQNDACEAAADFAAAVLADWFSITPLSHEESF